MTSEREQRPSYLDRYKASRTYKRARRREKVNTGCFYAAWFLAMLLAVCVLGSAVT